MPKLKLNIDGGAETIFGWPTWSPSLKGGSPGVSTTHANYIVIQRLFERLQDPHEFLREFYHLALADSELFLYSMDHDGVQNFIGGGREYILKAFGCNFEDQGCWLRKYNDIQDIINIFEDYGWIYEGTFDNVEGMPTPEYPHQRLKFRMSKVQPPHEYVLKDIQIKPTWNVIDIGPGNYPWPRANSYLEHPARKKNPVYDKEILPHNDKMIWGDIQNYNMSIPDKNYDFAFCSHVFEHLPDPHSAARELSRIAKQGVVVVPSAYKDCLTFWDEPDHKWECYPGRREQCLTMLPRPERFVNNIRDKQIQGAFNRLFIGSGEFETYDHRYSKKWFRLNERKLDIVIAWKDRFEVDIV